MIALRAHDDADAELLRLRSDLLAFVVDEITRAAPVGRSLTLAGPVADAITETAATATRAELIHLGQSLAEDVYGALEPQLEQRLPSLLKAAVATALAEQTATSRQPPAALFWVMLASNGVALAAALAVLYMR
jgi:hypothetical protein